jgi:hypothetical protein
MTGPIPHAPYLPDDAAAALRKDCGEHFAGPDLGLALSERAWSLRGFAHLLVDLIVNWGLVEEVLERIYYIFALSLRKWTLSRIDTGELLC